MNRVARTLKPQPRGGGKTTLIRAGVSPDTRDVTLDDPEVRALAQNEPTLFLRAYPAPLVLDEAH